MKTKAADIAALTNAMIDAAEMVIRDRSDADLTGIEQLRNIDPGTDFDLLILPTGQFRDESFLDPVLTGLFKWVRYANSEQGLSAGDCLDVEITMRQIQTRISQRHQNAFNDVLEMVTQAAEEKSGLDFIQLQANK